MDIAHILKISLKKMIQTGTLSKQDAFAWECGQTTDQLKQRLARKTPITLPEFWVYRDVIERLDPDVEEEFVLFVLGKMRED